MKEFLIKLRIFQSSGHDVWFDKNEIKSGDEWRRSITDGILGSNRVLSFLSKHSIRDYLLSKLASRLQNRPDAEKKQIKSLKKVKVFFFMQSVFVKKFIRDMFP